MVQWCPRSALIQHKTRYAGDRARNRRQLRTRRQDNNKVVTRAADEIGLEREQRQIIASGSRVWGLWICQITKPGRWPPKLHSEWTLTKRYA